MRGTRFHGPGKGCVSRFIPAYAGNARACGLRGGQNAVHPRVCGERLFAHTEPVNEIGSSPRMRGTQILDGHLSVSARFIPAYAGNAGQTT